MSSRRSLSESELCYNETRGISSWLNRLLAFVSLYFRDFLVVLFFSCFSSSWWIGSLSRQDLSLFRGSYWSSSPSMIAYHRGPMAIDRRLVAFLLQLSSVVQVRGWTFQEEKDLPSSFTIVWVVSFQPEWTFGLSYQRDAPRRRLLQRSHGSKFP